MSNKKKTNPKPKKTIAELGSDIKKLKLIGRKFMKLSQESKSDNQALELKKKAGTCIVRISHLKEYKKRILDVVATNKK